VYVDLGPPDGLLVLAIDDVGGTPGGILVGGTPDLRTVGIERGMALLPEAQGWSIPTAGVTIDASRAQTWSPALPASAHVRMTKRLTRAGTTAQALAADRAPAGGLAPLLSGRDRPGDPWLAVAAGCIRRQRDALAAGDVASALNPTVDLIGLGSGSTPSGDDYLVGLLAGLEATTHPARDAIAGAIVVAAPTRTTAIGAAMLGHATRGAFAERLHDVLVALAAGRTDGLTTAIERAMAYGATSGSDTLVGLFCALEIAGAQQTVAGRARPGRVAA